MTMDIHQRSLRAEVSPPFLPSERSPSNPPSPITDLSTQTQKPIKRSFDVAFLMAPDDLTTKKRQQQNQQLRLVTSQSLLQRYSPPEMTFAHTDSSEAVELRISRSLNHQRFLTGRGSYEFSSLPTSPLGLLIPSPRDFRKGCLEPKDSIIDVTQEEHTLQFARSAFTKVRSGKTEQSGASTTPSSPVSICSTVSGGGVSPDVSCQESLSPPLMSSSRSPVHYLQPAKSRNPSMSYFASGKTLPPVSPGYFYNNQQKEKLEGKSPSPVDINGFPHFMNKNSIAPIQKLRPMLYQGDTLSYGALPVTGYPFQPTGGSVPTHTLLTAAASVTAALLPPSLAALTLPAQNVCAKCKISFRMTSDLVYHMRSHHKGEHVAVDVTRRRRDQDKLRCPVCNETFRERHHLTRHMTAHQDKEGDRVDEDDRIGVGVELARRRHHGLPHK